ncbi:MAG TPA: type III secretion system export apparatus subunit SctV [Pyrinomonadaceae bacterium]|nr:type III secretion system export apparatus subunit SctV [Pyrinomonadaceae bacterium]
MKAIGNTFDLNSLLKQGNITGIMAKYKDLLLPVALLLAVGALFLPLPAEAVSVFIVINLAISITILVTAFFINSPVQLTAYPTILLLTTIFRLTLSVSVTRNILSYGEDGAGSVIHFLGNITAGGSIIVGAVLFIIILVVQFIVVSKGSERVAEVAARFTLDAMPGKQMAIDADLRSGLITQEQARAMRNELGKESQLHGAMDGAMKFVKGDAICTIIIALVNIIAGLATGVLVHKYTFGEAAQIYTIATFGDGLAAIISSLLVTLSAGIVVTRVASNDEVSNVGSDVIEQIFVSPTPVFIAGGIILLLAPWNFASFLVFAPVGAATILGAYFLKRRQKRLIEAGELPDMSQAASDSDELQMSFTVPMAIVVSRELSHLVDKNTPQGARFRAEIPKLRNALYYDLGVMVPFCYVGGDAPISPNEYYIAVKEVPVGTGSLRPDCVYVNDSAENIRVFGIEGENVNNPADLRPGAWIPAEQRHIAETAGLKVWEPADVMLLHLSRIMRRYAHDFIGIQEAQGYLDFVSRGMPKLVEETIGKVITIHQFTDVLQRLVQEGISIRDTKSILDALSEWGRIEKDPVMLTEHIRAAMRRYISFRYALGSDTLFVYLLDPEIEDVIRGAIRRTSTGSFLSLDPTIAHDILDAIRREIADQPPTAQQPVIVTDMELRRFVRKMVELEFSNLAVLSYQELTPELNIQPIGRISMRRAALNQGFGSFENEFADFPELMPPGMEELSN